MACLKSWDCGENSQGGATPMQAKWIKLDLDDSYLPKDSDQWCQPRDRTLPLSTRTSPYLYTY